MFDDEARSHSPPALKENGVVFNLFALVFCKKSSLIVQNKIRFPNHILRNNKFFDAIIIAWLPIQIVVIPFLIDPHIKMNDLIFFVLHFEIKEVVIRPQT